MDTLLRDVRLSLRGLRQRPVFAALAIATIGLGIGANSVMFSVVHATLLRRLPFPEPDRIVQLSLTTPPAHGEPARDDMVWSFPKYQTFAELQRSFSEHAIYARHGLIMATPDGAERLDAEDVSGQYLHLLGVSPLIGRDFGPEENTAPGAPRAALLTHGLWQRSFGADPAVIGRTISLDGDPAVVIGVLPPSFRGLGGRADLFLNVASRSADDLGQRWSHSYELVARLAPGVSIPRARAEVERLGRQIHEAHISRFDAADAGPWGAALRPLDAIRFDPAMSRSAIALTAAVALVLLLACANLAGLLLARATSRSREIAVRFALGATRGAVVRQMLADGAVLAVLGGMAGVGGAAIATAALRREWAAGATAMGRIEGLTLLGMDAIRLDGSVLLFSAAVVLLTAALVGLLPALRSSRADLTRDLKAGPARVDGTRRWLRLGGRDLMVAAEIALAMVLLAGAGLLLRSLDRLLAVDVGVDPSHVATVRFALPAGDRSGDSTAALHAALIDRVRAVPGVTAAAIGNCPPLAGGCNGSVIWFRDRPEVPEGTEPGIGVQFVSPDYPEVLGLRVLRGRWFTRGDRLGTPKVVVINETAARAYWPGEDPIGRPVGIGMGGFADRAEVIGVVSDVRFGTVEDAPVPDAFISYLQSPRGSGMLFVRSAAPPAAILPVIRAALRDVDRQIAVYDERPLADRIRLATIRQRFTGGVLTTFAIAALALAAIGLYGLISWEVGRRTREIGIRMAVGARADSILGLVAGRAALLTGLGLAVGLVVSLALNRLLQSLLFGVRATDPVTYLAMSGLLVAVAAAATIGPARRAARVDPATVIREA